MERVIRDFRTEIAGIESKLNDKQTEINELKLKFESELKASQVELENERVKSKDTHKEISKNKLLDLELADYERSIKALNAQIQSKDNQINEIKNETNILNESIAKAKVEYETLLKEKENSDEKSAKLKELLVKAKKEVSEAQQHEAQHLNNDVQMKSQIESYNLEIEKYKVLLADAAVNTQKIQDKFNKNKESYRLEVDELEEKYKSAEDARVDLNKQLIKVKKEYENYKVKVQHAFKKQKEQNESDLLVSSNADNKNDNEIQSLTEKNEQLIKKMAENNEKLELFERENEALQEEFTKSLQRNTSLLNELKEKEKEWRLKTEEFKKQDSLKKDESEEIIRNLEIEKEAQSLNFKEKLRQLNSQNSQAISELQNQILESKQEIDRLNRLINEFKEKANNSLQANEKNSPLDVSNTSSSSQKDSLLARLTPQKSIDLTNNFILRQVENIDRSLDENKQNSANKTLEELLNESPVVPSKSPSNSITPDSKTLLQQMEHLKTDMNKGKLQLVHLNELLNESELNNSRLSEQINVLKDEIRRLERNQERETSISNMEYLKNVVYKFLTFSNTEERTQLLPVLSTMLKLSPAEQNAIMNTKVTSHTIGSVSEGWSTYLPKWT